MNTSVPPSSSATGKKFFKLVEHLERSLFYVCFITVALPGITQPCKLIYRDPVINPSPPKFYLECYIRGLFQVICHQSVSQGKEEGSPYGVILNSDQVIQTRDVLWPAKKSKPTLNRFTLIKYNQTCKNSPKGVQTLLDFKRIYCTCERSIIILKLKTGF